MNRKSPQYLTFTISILILLSHFNLKADEPVPEERFYKGVPSWTQETEKLEIMTTKFACIAEHDGEYYNCPLESELLGFADVPNINTLITGIPELTCSNVTSSVEDIFIHGGHSEPDRTTEFVYAGTSYKLDGSNSPSERRFFVEGETNGNSASKFTYTTTREAGIFSARTRMDVPEHPSPNYIWRTSQGFDHAILDETHLQGILGLVRLPGCPDGKPITGQNYILKRNDTSRHMESHWGRPDTILMATAFANKVWKDYRVHMSYNDLSLPIGGRLKPHSTHLTGRDIDINGGGMGYDCNRAAPNPSTSLYLHAAMNDIFGPSSITSGSKIEPNLDCYVGQTNMHIDVSEGR